LRSNIVAEHANAKRMTIMGVLLHWTQANSFELVVHQSHGRRQGGKTGIFPSLGIGTKNQYFLENLMSAFICRYDTHTTQESDSLFWCHAAVSLQFTHVHSFACRGTLPKLRADCFTVGLYCVTITWQQIF